MKRLTTLLSLLCLAVPLQAQSFYPPAGDPWWKTPYGLIMIAAIDDTARQFGLGNAMPMMQAAAPAQTWITVAHDGDSNLVIPTGATLRYGAKAGTPYGCGTGAPLAADAWATPTVSGPIADLGGLAVPDPAQCYVKELDIAETASVQTVTVNGVAVSIPALPPPPALSAGQHTVVLTAVYPPPGDANATWFGAGNLLAGGGGSSTWESSAFNITVDGQTLVCAYKADAYTPNQFTFSCTTVAAVATSP